MELTREELRVLREVQADIIIAKDDKKSTDGKVRLLVVMDREIYGALHFIEIPKS